MHKLKLGRNNYPGINRVFAVFVMLAAMLASPLTHAGLLDWSLAGPGTTDITTTGETTAFSYNASGFQAYVGGTWFATATVAEAGDYTFDWTYWGEHAFFQTNAFLIASNGSTVDTLLDFSPFDGFYTGGSYTFANAKAGDTLQFRFGGSNNDSNPLLLGTVAITQRSEVPEPASLGLLALGALGIVAARRKRLT